MKMWTHGLGNIELVVDGMDMEVEKKDGNTVITGITEEPVQWIYEVTLEKDDIPAILHLIFRYNTLLYVFKNKGLIFRLLFKTLFSRNKVSREKAVEGNPK